MFFNIYVHLNVRYNTDKILNSVFQQHLGFKIELRFYLSKNKVTR